MESELLIRNIIDIDSTYEDFENSNDEDSTEVEKKFKESKKTWRSIYLPSYA